MPYIKQDKRNKVREGFPEDNGDLNFLFFELFQNHFLTQGMRYQQVHEVLRAIESCKLFIATGQNPYGLTNDRLTLSTFDMIQKKMTGTQFGDVIGALEGAKLEFYRRIAGGYEDLAIIRNGDVLLPEIKEKLTGDK